MMTTNHAGDSNSFFKNYPKYIYFLSGFLLVFSVVLAGNIIGDILVRSDEKDYFLQFRKFIAPVITGLLAGGFGIFVWTKKNQHIQSLKTLLESENKFNTIFHENSSVCLIIEPQSGKIIEANKTALEFYGYNYEEIKTIFISDLNVLSKEETDLKMKTAFESKKKHFRCQHRLRSGEIKHVEIYATLIPVDRSEFLFALIHDITDNIKTEALNNMLKYSLDVYTDGIYWMNSSNRFIYVNEAGGKAFGCKPEELLGKHLSEVNPTTTEESLADLWYNLRTHGTFTAETVHRRFDGTEFYAEIRSVYFKYEGQEYNNGYARDITARKLIEKELIKAKEIAEENEKNLRLSEEKLRVKLDFILSPQIKDEELNLTDIIDLKLLQSMQEAFTKATGVASIITKPDGTPITKASNFSGICQMIRQTESGLKKCILSDKMIGQKAVESRGPVIEKCRSCGLIDSGAPIFIGDRFVAIWMIGQIKTEEIDNTRIEIFADEIRADKIKMKLEFEKMHSVSRSQFAEIVNLLWIFVQELSSVAYSNLLLAKKIEEQKEYENKLIIAKNKAEESDRLKTAFLQNMNHEIRTPMNAIIGFSGLLTENFDNKEKLAEFSEIITQRCKDLLTIIDDILNIAQIESGQTPVNIDSCNLDSLFSDIHLFFREGQLRLHKQHISFQTENNLPPALNHISTDPLKLKQILINLTGNAFKFTNNGNIAIGVKPGINNSHIFYVSDTGIGIPKDKHHAIFERFYQVDHGRSRVFEGNGLGLSIVKGLVNILDGEVWLESEPGKGSTFYFTIHSKNKIEKGLNQPESVDENYDKYTNILSKKILVVEDDKDNAGHIKNLLSSFKADLLFAENGQDAVKIAIEKLPDLILMDIGLPDMLGYEAIHLIKQRNPDLKVIAMTAYPSGQDKNQALRNGCVDSLSKPIDPKKLLSLINLHL
jgi:PAS domain S-box-containing protein